MLKMMWKSSMKTTRVSIVNASNTFQALGVLFVYTTKRGTKRSTMTG